MIAIDLGKLVVWGSYTKQRIPLKDFLSVYSHMDSKLRGFGAVSRVRSGGDISGEYRLLCGRGIKNIHIWTFIPPNLPTEVPQWTCLYDMPTNGNTIETMFIRSNGSEVLTKSSGTNLRVWDLMQCNSNYSCSMKGKVTEVSSGPSTTVDSSTPNPPLPSTPSSPTPRPLYDDLPNTQEIRTITSRFAFGGTYQFQIVSLHGNSKGCARELVDLPVRAVEDDNGQRRKR